MRELLNLLRRETIMLKEKLYRLVLDPIRYLGPIGWIQYLIDADRRHGQRIHPLDWKEWHDGA